MNKITSTYLHSLQSIYNRISLRGIRMDLQRLEAARLFVDLDIERNLDIASKHWGCLIYAGADKDKAKVPNSCNINSTQGEKSFLNKLIDLGYNVPKITKKNDEGDYEQKESTAELVLQKILAANQFNTAGGDPGIRAILRVRELGKIRSSYINARLLEREGGSYYQSGYNVAGTVTGRRSSKQHIFGFGNNAQNLPTRGDLAKIYKSCLVSRLGNIFLFVDQIQAEEWPVSALSMNEEALHDLRTGVDRHSKLASVIFECHVPPKGGPGWDKKIHDIQRYMGKKTKHARNYGMKAPRMSDSLAQEGYSISKALCEQMLKKAHLADPSVEDVFQFNIRAKLSQDRILSTPFGRERLFLELRPNADNSSAFNEGYSYIPQSVVGDDTGFALFQLESDYDERERAIIQEGHDSLVQDIPAKEDSIWTYLQRTIKAFDRPIRFSNGIEINIPIEAEIGYNFEQREKIEDMSFDGVREAWRRLK